MGSMKSLERARAFGRWVKAVGPSVKKSWLAWRPGPAAGIAARRAVLAAAVAHLLLGTAFQQLGFGLAADFGFVFAVAALVWLAILLILALGIGLLRNRQPTQMALVIASLILIALVWKMPYTGPLLAAWIGASAAALGASLGMWRAGEKRRLTAALLLAGFAGTCVYVWMIAHDGSEDELSRWKPPAASLPPVLSLPNPAEKGPFGVRTAFYGAGTDIRRPEFGPHVAIRSRTVDASEFFRDYSGWKRNLRKFYWGFDLDKLPLNGRVWYPDGPGPFPLALMVHGNHNMADFSDPGYAYLGELLASRGFVFVSIDENFLNGGLFGEPPNQQPVRGWLLLEHLKLWREWTAASAHAFAGKVDVERVALLGHSRGGEAVATAALFNRLRYYPDNANIRFHYGFPLRALVAIAPVDGQYKPSGAHRWIEDISYFTLHGAHDADVSSFFGSRQWDHLRFTKPGPSFKAELWTYRANHGQFNTSWGRYDSSPPQGWMLNTRPLLAAEEQRRISKTYICAFLEATLRDRAEYKGLFADWRTGRHWLPETIYSSRYRDPDYVPLAAYREDADLTTGSQPGLRIEGEGLLTWREGRIPWRSSNRDYNGVFLGWKNPQGGKAASYQLTLSEKAVSEWKLDERSTVEVSVAALDEDPREPAGKNEDQPEPKKERESPDFTLQLITPAGVASVPVSRFQSIPPPLKAKLVKLNLNDDAKDWEPVFQTVRIPLRAFGVAPSQLRALRLQFDRSPTAVICISAIGFGRE